MAYDASVSGGKGVTVEQVKEVAEILRDSGYAYEHPTQSAMLGEPTSNQTPGFGGTFTVSQISSDFQGHVSGLTDRTVRIPDSVATSSAKGLMSASDKTKLDNEVLSNLQTVTKSSLVGAINDIDSRILCGGVPYGKELTESWQSLQARISTGDFSGIHIGDYKTITLTTNEVVIMEVAGIDQYYKFGDSSLGHHVDFISRDCLVDNKRMNATATNNGTAAEKHPWLASELNQTLNDETTGVFSTLPSDLKPYIIQKRALLEERYSSGGAVAADTGVSFANMGKLWLPTEGEIFDHPVWSERGFGTFGSAQYPLFMGGFKHIAKMGPLGRSYWWMASASCMDDKSFCCVDYTIHASYSTPNVTYITCPLCFRIG